MKKYKKLGAATTLNSGGNGNAKLIGNSMPLMLTNLIKIHSSLQN